MGDPFAAERPALLGLAYRLLGDRGEAEDVVQEAWLRWAAATSRTAAPDNPAAWLRTVVTRLCLDVLRSARVRREAYVGPWLPEPVHTADGALGPLDTAELRDTLSLGVLHLLERLSPVERAVFVLREAFGLPYEEVAEAVGRTPAACRQLRSRATAKLDGPLPAGLPAQRRGVLDALVLAVATGDVPAVTALLAHDAVLVSDGGGVVSAARRPVVGADRVARFLVGIAGRAPVGVVLGEEEVNGAPCLVARVDGAVTQVLAVTVTGARVTGVQVLANPHKLMRLSQDGELSRRTG